MKISPASLTAVFLLGLLIIGFLASPACSTQSSSGSTPVQSQSETSPSDNNESTSVPSSTTQPSTEVSSPTVETTPVSVVVAGYINHGPLQPTVRAIKEVLSKYDNKVAVTWIDLATAEGQTYFQEHGTATLSSYLESTSL